MVNLELNNFLLRTFYQQAIENMWVLTPRNFFFVMSHPILSMQLIWFAVKVIGVAQIDNNDKLHNALGIKYRQDLISDQNL
mgnify:CR=1 FL=1